MQHEDYMRLAIEQAEEAFALGERIAYGGEAPVGGMIR